MKIWQRKSSASRQSELDLISVARSHIGSVRTVNEDRVLDQREGGLWAVADGMGGHSRGDEAATVAVRSLAALLRRSPDIGKQAITEALDEANSAIFDKAQSARRTCGSTIVGMRVRGRSVLLFWVGDSRAYRLRDGVLERLTRDHSVVQELSDAGVITSQQARHHPQANVITRALGVGQSVVIDFAQHSIREKDLYLLCSDGLTGLVDDDAIRDMLALDMETAASSLVDASLAAGGSDNISLVLIGAGAAAISDRSTVYTGRR
ncbi:protein phosphatase 2C domain-containing protein [Sphingobium subterraneum]|uniref:Serine/threonine protein phosphatase PrpC n=1 Tax=Sphingobium subterraneum TaxID=627688 RepID=A0A841J0K0_9SPHN|nr:serine/threonine protein phosphatase PrpC [Sphingobium subterraneum]